MWLCSVDKENSSQCSNPGVLWTEPLVDVQGIQVITWRDPSGGEIAADLGLQRSHHRLDLLAQKCGEVQATHSASAAIQADGSVLTWGHPDCGGDSSKFDIS